MVLGYLFLSPKSNVPNYFILIEDFNLKYILACGNLKTQGLARGNFAKLLHDSFLDFEIRSGKLKFFDNLKKPKKFFT